MRAALAILVLLAACVHAVRMPATIRHGGGTYIPWDAQHEANRRDVYACVGLADDRPPPTLWISLHPLVDTEGNLLMAYYDLKAHAIVYAPYVQVADYWLVFRHEVLHASERVRGHGPLFALDSACHFWPAGI